MASAVEAADLQKADKLWFSPDVVVLRAQPRIFRVFVAILKEKSSVFADMFTFPQPPSLDMETMDGFPVVDLYDDPAEMEVFLKAIFDSDFFMPPPALTKFEDIVGILRLSHKYDVPFLRRRALKHLGTLYHTRLSERESKLGENSVEFAQPLETTLYNLVTIKVAVEVAALWLLPVAYYDLCDCEIQTIITAGEPWDTLGEVQRMTCIIGHSAQIQLFPKIIAFYFPGKTQYSDCADWTQCNAVRLEYVGEVGWSMRRPLEALYDEYWADIESSGLCGTCLDEMKERHKSAKQQFWDDLPHLFGLPDWPELEEMRRIALNEG